MATIHNNIDEFLKHRTNDRTGGFLENWRKNTPPVINTWPHTRLLPIALARHNFPRVVEREDRKTGQKLVNVWSGDWNCREVEAIIKKQYRRDENGRREAPPVACGFCRGIEEVRRLVDAGELDWLEPIFVVRGGEDEEVIHAGGWFNAFGDDDLNPHEIEQMRAAGIRRDEAWTENGQAKWSYVMQIVDADNVGAGVQIAIETGLLGEKIKEVFNDVIADLGSEKGNPMLHPYVIQWEHLPKEPEFSKKYKARRLTKYELTPAVEKLIRGEPLDISKTIAPLNNAQLRAIFEKFCVTKKIDWDKVFAVDEAKGVQEQVPEFPSKAREEEAPAAKSLPAAPPRQQVEQAPAALPPQQVVDPDACPACGKTETTGCPHVACDECDKPMLPTDPKCAACGHVYIVVEPTPPPAPKRRRRSATPEGG